MKCFQCNTEMQEITRDRKFNNKIIKNIKAFECKCGNIIYPRESAKMIERLIK